MLPLPLLGSKKRSRDDSSNNSFRPFLLSPFPIPPSIDLQRRGTKPRIGQKLRTLRKQNREEGKGRHSYQLKEPETFDSFRAKSLNIRDGDSPSPDQTILLLFPKTASEESRAFRQSGFFFFFFFPPSSPPSLRAFRTSGVARRGIHRGGGGGDKADFRDFHLEPLPKLAAGYRRRRRRTQKHKWCAHLLGYAFTYTTGEA